MSVLTKPAENRRKMSEFNMLGCPLTGNRTPWCFNLCTPKNGKGHCGRYAPHAIKGRTQLAIEAHNRKKRKAVNLPVNHLARSGCPH